MGKRLLGDFGCHLRLFQENFTYIKPVVKQRSVKIEAAGKPGPLPEAEFGFLTYAPPMLKRILLHKKQCRTMLTAVH